MRTGKYLHWYYISVIGLFLGLALVAGYFVWNQGVLNDTRSNSILEASLLLRQDGTHRDIQDVGEYISTGQSDIAGRVFEDIEGNLRIFNRAHKTPQYAGVYQSWKKVHQTLGELNSLTPIHQLLVRHTERLFELEGLLIRENKNSILKNIRTLRYEIKFSNLRGKKGFIQKIDNRYSALSNNIRKTNIRRIAKIQILPVLDKLAGDMDQLKKHSLKWDQLDAHFRDFKLIYLSWYKKVAPDISHKRILVENNSKVLLIGLVVAFFLSIVFISLGFWLYSYNKKYDNKNIAHHVVSVIQGKILAEREEDNSNHEDNTDGGKLWKLRRYVQKRMALGSIFQETLPFAAASVDENNEISWANNHFYRIFNLSQQKELRWNEIKEKLELDSFDPVLTSRENNESCVHHIDIPNSDGDVSFFDMYVSSCESQGKKNTMLFLYPLAAQEARTKFQNKQFINSINDMMDAIIKKNVPMEDRETIRKTFNDLGIAPVWDKITQCFNHLRNQEQELVAQITEFKRVIDIGSQDTKDNLKNDKIIVKELTNFKNNFITIAESSNEFRRIIGGYLSRMASFRSFQKNIQQGLEYQEHIGKFLQGYGVQKRALREALEQKDISKVAEIQKNIDVALSKIEIFHHKLEENNTDYSEISFDSDIENKIKNFILKQDEFEDLLIGFLQNIHAFFIANNKRHGNFYRNITEEKSDNQELHV